MKLIVFFAGLALLGCQRPDPTSPKGAFQKLGQCVDTRDLGCFYRGLDTESRWSIQTIHKYLKEASSLVEKTYPADHRQSAFGSWREEALAADADAAFEAWCRKRLCLEQFAEGFGAIVKTTEKKKGSVVVETTRGKAFEMSFAEGKWGLALFREELQQGKLRALDRLEQIRKNAAEFEEQRRAVGSPEQAGHEKKGE